MRNVLKLTEAYFGNAGDFSLLAFGEALMMRWFSYPRRAVSVIDVRLRDNFGQEHLVRIQGDLTAGNVIPGDNVDVQGFDHKFHRGWNWCTRSQIIVKH